jgi:hypothetical protein
MPVIVARAQYPDLLDKSIALPEAFYPGYLVVDVPCQDLPIIGSPGELVIVVTKRWLNSGRSNLCPASSAAHLAQLTRPHLRSGIA